MKLTGTSNRYGVVAVWLHWTSAVAIFVALPLGFLASFAMQAQQAVWLRAHVLLGISAVVLTIVRIGWRIFDTRPPQLAGLPRWQTISAGAIHFLLYVLLIIMGSSGIGLMVLSGAAAILFFGSSRPLPNFDAFAPMAVHLGCAVVLMGVLCVHIGAALHHQFIRRDRLLARMGIGSAAQK